MVIVDPEWQYTSLGRSVGAGGLSLRTRDFMNLATLFVRAGNFNGQRILPAEWLQRSMTTHVEATNGQEYGYLIWKSRHEIGGRGIVANFMSGNGGNRVVFIPELELVIVITKTDYGRQDAHEQSERLMLNILQRFLGGQALSTTPNK